MKNKKILSISFLLIMILSLFSPLTVFAEETHTVAIIDNANLLSDMEEEMLRERAIPFSNNYGIDIVFLTTDDTNGKSTMVYTDDFYDGIEGGVTYSEDGFLLVIDMDNREIYINTLGKVLAEVNDAEVDDILDEGYRYVTNKDYLNTFNAMFDATTYAYENVTYGYSEEIARQHETNPSLFVSFISIFNPFTPICLFCLIIAVIMFISLNSAHKKNNTPGTIKNYGEGKKGYVLNRKNDVFIKSFTTVDRGYYKPSNSSSGGGSRGGSSHRSSSGRSHGGGGRRF